MHQDIVSGKEYLSATFNNVVMSDASVTEAEFEGCQFIECNFTETTFRKCKFIDCVFKRCNLSVLKVPLSQFNGVHFEECKMVGVDWTRAAWPRYAFAASIRFCKCVLNDSSFFGLSLDELVLEECKAHDVDFREGRFNKANFTYTDFTNSLFGKTHLAGADFSEAIQYDIDIFNNTLTGARFTRHEAVRLLNGLEIELVD